MLDSKIGIENSRAQGHPAQSIMKRPNKEVFP